MEATSGLSYKRTVLYGNESFEIVSCEWVKGSVSPLHSHGWSQCLVLVEEGLFENRSEFGLKSEITLHEVGQVLKTPLGVQHEIICLSEKGKTLHVYLPRISAEKVAPHFRAGTLSELKKQLDLSLDDKATRWAVLEDLMKEIGKSSVSVGSPFFMNQLFAGVFPETLAAEELVARHRTTLATFEAGPAFTAIELEVVQKLGELIGWDSEHRDGISVPGGSAANFMAIHCARHRKVPEFRTRGSNGEKFKIFVSTAAHYSMLKGAIALGLGTDAVVEVAVDQRHRMDPEDLKSKVHAALAKGEIPLLVVATAGTTVYGSFDPISPLSEICQEHAMWLHLDGAWGGPALFSKKARNLVEGAEKIDSMTFDGHKLFGSNLTASFFLTRHTGLLQEANDVSGGSYIFHSDEVVQDRGRLAWQCGRGADAVAFWTLWKNVGTQGLGSFVDRLFEIRDETVKFIKNQDRLELVSKPEYLNICVRVRPPSMEKDPQWSKKVRESLIAKNLAMVNFAQDQDGTFLRMILAHPELEVRHTKQILEWALGLRASYELSSPENTDSSPASEI